MTNSSASKGLSPTERSLLTKIADLRELPVTGAFNLRANGEAAARRSSPNIEIRPKTDRPGIDVLVKPGTKGEQVHIPVILTKAGLNDLVYNTFVIGEGADVLVVAGCGIHNPGEAQSGHDGLHEVFVEAGARLRYVEKHLGEGVGRRVLNPKTIVHVARNGVAELELVQLGGVDDTRRVTEADVAAGGRLLLTERLLTEEAQQATSEVTVVLAGRSARAEVLSRSVARDRSRQDFFVEMTAEAPAKGHISCDGIVMDQAEISSTPALRVRHGEAEMTHEAAIGRIDGDQLIKLMTMGLTREEAIREILAAYLS